jgi:hypothetical protein
MTKRLGKTAKFDLVSLIKIEKKNLSNYYYVVMSILMIITVML